MRFTGHFLNTPLHHVFKQQDKISSKRHVQRELKQQFMLHMFEFGLLKKVEDQFMVVEALHKQVEDLHKQVEDLHKQVEHPHKQVEHSRKQVEHSRKQVEHLHKQVEYLHKEVEHQFMVD